VKASVFFVFSAIYTRKCGYLVRNTAR